MFNRPLEACILSLFYQFCFVCLLIDWFLFWWITPGILIKKQNRIELVLMMISIYIVTSSQMLHLHIPATLISKYNYIFGIFENSCHMCFIQTWCTLSFALIRQERISCIRNSLLKIYKKPSFNLFVLLAKNGMCNYSVVWSHCSFTIKWIEMFPHMHTGNKNVLHLLFPIYSRGIFNFFPWNVHLNYSALNLPREWMQNESLHGFPLKKFEKPNQH